ncbi:hypothetical protein DESA109040_02450 [Deinococcus saxicola]|uniref:hypothetical protein n=1 Tax=Deinococcus saxicola TaxID=249406 RepID=UPI0039F0BDAE
MTTSELDFSGLNHLKDADHAGRQSVLDDFLIWLDRPANQPRQICGTLYGPAGSCCALGGLGAVLQAHGYARIQPTGDGRVYLTMPSLDGQAAAGWRSETHMAMSVLDALGLRPHWEAIITLNDVSHAPFSEIGQYLHAQHPNAPETLPS